MTWKSSSSRTLFRSSQPLAHPCASPLPPSPNWLSADSGVACWKERPSLHLSSGSSWHRWLLWETALNRLSWAPSEQFSNFKWTNKQVSAIFCANPSPFILPTWMGPSPFLNRGSVCVPVVNPYNSLKHWSKPSYSTLINFRQLGNHLKSSRRMNWTLFRIAVGLHKPFGNLSKGRA